MSGITEAEQYLLDQIRAGDDQAWSSLVQRYHGRLFAYARKQLPQSADAEDVVQDTFVNFIRGLAAFRAQCTVESYLFTILRRKIIEIYRRSHRKMNLVHDLFNDSTGELKSDYLPDFTAPEPTASWYVRRDERKEAIFEAFATALLKMLDGIKKSENFDHLKAIELLFFCELSNSQAADTADMDASRIGVIKHRCIKQLKESLELPDLRELSDGDFEGIIAQVWQQCRPSCPKRNTIGAYLLGTLDSDWTDYIQFHLETLGCQFCQANLQDLKLQNEQKGSEKLQERIMESTIGFLKK